MRFTIEYTTISSSKNKLRHSQCDLHEDNTHKLITKFKLLYPDATIKSIKPNG